MLRRRGGWLGFVAVAVMLSGCGRLGFDRFDFTDGDNDAGPGDAGARDGGQDGGVEPRDGGVDASSPEDAGQDGGAGDAGGSIPGFGHVFTFDDGLEGWVPVDVDSPPGFIDGTVDDFGGVFDQWWTPPDPSSGDRALGIYRSNNTSSLGWAWRTTNDTGRTIVGLRVSYDLELHFTRFQFVDPDGVEYGLREARAAWFAGIGGRDPVAVSPAVDNRLLGPDERARWLFSAETDALGVNRRALVVDLPGFDVAPGASVDLTLGVQFVGSAGEERHVLFAIDDVLIEPIHP